MYNKLLLKKYHESKDESKNNKNEINILDISNSNFVNDRNEEKKDNTKINWFLIGKNTNFVQ